MQFLQVGDIKFEIMDYFFKNPNSFILDILPENFLNARASGSTHHFTIDFKLTSLLNSPGFLVARVIGNGYCLINAVSMAICGDLSLVELLRRRLVDFYISSTAAHMFFTCILS